VDPYLLLAVAEGVGPGMVTQLLDPDIGEEALRPFAELELPPAAGLRLRSPRLGDEARTWLQRAERHGQAVVTRGHDAYPERLRHAPLPPLALFAAGEPRILARSPAVAVVGSRTPTSYGIAAATDFTAALARAGVVLWSGLAFGIDAIAHEAALDAGTPTVAVLAGGLDRPHPAAHEPLARRILEAGGLCLSESPPERPPTRGHFPRRNRILAGAVDAVLVVEAGERSGTLHTARFAADAGRPVFVVPGPYTSPRSRGCHQLLAAGAHVAVDPSHLLDELGIHGRLSGDERGGAALARSADEQRILAAVRSGPRPIDAIQRETRLGEERFLEVLFELLADRTLLRLPGDLIGLGRSPG
jgi:DNA processing protein